VFLCDSAAQIAAALYTSSAVHPFISPPARGLPVKTSGLSVYECSDV